MFSGRERGEYRQQLKRRNCDDAVSYTHLDVYKRQLEELLNTDHASAVTMVNDAFNEDMKVHPDLYFQGTQCEVSDEFSEIGYYRTEAGIVLRAQLYWLGPFAAGSQEVVLKPAENN